MWPTAAACDDRCATLLETNVPRSRDRQTPCDHPVKASSPLGRRLKGGLPMAFVPSSCEGSTAPSSVASADCSLTHRCATLLGTNVPRSRDRQTPCDHPIKASSPLGRQLKGGLPMAFVPSSCERSTTTSSAAAAVCSLTHRCATLLGTNVPRSRDRQTPATTP